jgi:integrase
MDTNGHQKMYVKKSKKSGKKKWEVGLPRLNGKRPRKFFATKDQAEAYLKAKQLELENHGTQALLMTDAQRAEYFAAKRKLPEGTSLIEAADYWVKERATVKAVTLEKASEEFLAERKNSGLSARYPAQIGYKLKNFLVGRGKELCSDVDPGTIRAWINAQGWGSETRRGYVTDLRTFFGWCHRQNYCNRNPALAVEKPKRQPTPPRALTIPQIKALLQAGLKVDPEITGGHIAVILFGGPRTSEAYQLGLGNVTKELIDIEASKAKTRRRRLIEPNAQLQEWLKLCKGWPVGNIRRRVNKVRKAAAKELHGEKTKDKFPWPKNCLRHSFCSYSMQVHGARATAEAAGHSEQMLFAAYRAIVSKTDAQEWARLTPSLLLHG